MAAQTLEERVAALENRLEQIEHQQEPDKVSDPMPWWKKIVGVFKDDPEFEEAVRFGREWREAQRFPEDEDID